MGIPRHKLPERILAQVRAKQRKAPSDGKAFSGGTQRIFIGKLPPGLNGENGIDRMHWTAREELLKRWVQYVFAQQPNKHGGKVNIRYTRISTQPMDHDNLGASFKFVGDALVKNGVIEDDNPQVIINFTTNWRKADSMREQGVLIEIENAT